MIVSVAVDFVLVSPLGKIFPVLSISEQVLMSLVNGFDGSLLDSLLVAKIILKFSLWF
jgi:hypothetical protein